MAVGPATWTLAGLTWVWLRRADAVLVNRAAHNAATAMADRRGWDLEGARTLQDLEQALASERTSEQFREPADRLARLYSAEPVPDEGARFGGRSALLVDS